MRSAAPILVPLSLLLHRTLPLAVGGSDPSPRSHPQPLTLDRGIETAIYDSADAATIRLDAYLPASLSLKATDATSFDQRLTLSYSSDFVPRQELLPSSYSRERRRRHCNCQHLFDRYQTEALWCKTLPDGKSTNVRWRASWAPAGSTWLYGLAGGMGWNIETRSPDPSRISTFSWGAVLRIFAQASRTGTINLPISSVEGNTVVSVGEQTDSDRSCPTGRPLLSIRETIDLVGEADAGRLQNRKVAQELASWLDVSRRPDETDRAFEEWSEVVRSRILFGVPGAGPLDVDPNEDSEGAKALVFFGGICLAALGFSFNILLADEIVGSTGAISGLCDDAPTVKFGAGYLSECFGPYGDGPYLRLRLS